MMALMVLEDFVINIVEVLLLLKVIIMDVNLENLHNVNGVEKFLILDQKCISMFIKFMEDFCAHGIKV